MSRTFVTLRVARPKFAPLTLRKLHYIPGTLSEMPAVALMEDDKDVEFG